MSILVPRRGGRGWGGDGRLRCALGSQAGCFADAGSGCEELRPSREGQGLLENGEARDKRVCEMKSWMPCNACKAECPCHNAASTGSGANNGGRKDKSILVAVTEDPLSDTEIPTWRYRTSSFCHSPVYSAQAGEEQQRRLPLCDACCARPVVT